MLKAQNNWEKKIILFFVSQSITLFGSQIVQMAIVWYVTLSTARGIWVAAFSICSYLPQFLISFAGGVWADRYNRKRMILYADASIAIVTFGMFLILPYISQSGILLGMLLAMSVLRSLGAGIQSPAVNAAIAQIVPKEHLMRYNGMNSSMQAAVQFFAPAVAGVVLTMGTLRSTLMIDIFTAIIGIGLFSHIRMPKSEKQKASASTVFSDIKTGIQYAFGKPLIGGLLMVYGLFTFFCVPAGYLSGLFVSRVYGETYWYLTAVELCGFGGMMTGGLLMSVSGGFKKRRTTMFIGLAVFGGMAIGMGAVKQFVLYLAFMVIYGVALTTVQTTINTSLQVHTESVVQGRVFGFIGSMYAVCYPAGMTVFGLMADRIPLQWIMEASGIVLILMSIYIAAKRDLRGM